MILFQFSVQNQGLWNSCLWWHLCIKALFGGSIVWIANTLILNPPVPWISSQSLQKAVFLSPWPAAGLGTSGQCPGLWVSQRFTYFSYWDALCFQVSCCVTGHSSSFLFPYFLHFRLCILIHSRLISLAQASSLSSCLVAKVEFLTLSASPLLWMAWSSIPSLVQVRKLMPESVPFSSNVPKANTSADFVQLISNHVSNPICSYFFLFLLLSAETDHHFPLRLWS